LRVEAAELIGGPAGEGVVNRGVHAQQHLLAVIHGSRIESAGVDHGRSWLVTAEHYHQVTHHGRFALLVEIDNIAFVEAGEGHFHHPDSAFDDAGACCDDCVGLLTAEHGLGDLRRVSEVADAHLDDLHPGDRDALGHLHSKLAGDDIGRAAQRQTRVRGVVVGMRGGNVS
jgi:hypothetical protein